MDAHRSDALTDSAIDRKIQDLLAIEPSPDFAARVRAQIDVQPQRAPWLTWPRVAVALASLAVVVVTAVVTVREAESPQPAAVSAPATIPLQPAPLVALDAPPPAPMSSRSRAHRSRVQTHNGADDVIMPRDEVRGMQKLLAMAAQRDMRLASMFDVPDTSATSPLAEPPPIVIEPLRIEPLVPDSY
jgi:hypothetical protein